jgi:glycogen(starch) synthase
MKVVIASHDFFPAIGGVSTTVAIFAQGFVAAGHEVTVATLRDGPTEGYGFTVVRRPGPAALFRLYREADILILTNLAIRLLYPLLFIRRLFALQHHSESAFGLSRSPLSTDILRRAVLPRARHFMTSAYVGRRSGYAKYAVTHPFADPKHITQDVIAPITQRRGLLFVGRVEPEKGVLYLLDQWPRIRAALGVQELRIVGGGSLSGEIERRIGSGEVQDVTFTGPLERDATAREMGQAAYLVVPSFWAEPFGAVALEGIAAGAIVILTDRGGLPETTGSLGHFFDPDRQDSLDSALASARAAFEAQAASPDERARYMEAVRTHVDMFSPGSVVQKTVNVMTQEMR